MASVIFLHKCILSHLPLQVGWKATLESEEMDWFLMLQDDFGGFDCSVVTVAAPHTSPLPGEAPSLAHVCFRCILSTHTEC